MNNSNYSERHNKLLLLDIVQDITLDELMDICCRARAKKPCDYCDDNYDNSLETPMEYGDANLEIINGDLTVKLKLDYYKDIELHFSCNYCYMCGRRLPKE